MDEKQLLEEYAAQYFIAELNKLEGHFYKIVAHGDRPDFLVEDSKSGEKLGVEITHLFYDPDEAKILLGRSQQLFHGKMDIRQLIGRLNKLLLQKAEKAKDYAGADRLILLIRVASPVFTREDFERHEKDILMNDNLYWQVWLLFRNETDLGWGDLKRLK